MKYAKLIPSIIRIVAIIAIIAFFVPYCCVSCEGEVDDISLLNMATGFDAFDEEDFHVDPEPIVAILLASPFVVLAVSFLVRKEVPKACINAVCAAVTLFYNSYIAGDIEKRCAESGCTVEMRIANTIYIVYGLALIIISLYSVYLEYVRKKDVRTSYTTDSEVYPGKEEHRIPDGTAAATRAYSPERAEPNPAEWGASTRADTYPDTYRTVAETGASDAEKHTNPPLDSSFKRAGDL